MKSLSKERDKQEVIERLGTLRPDSARRWGKMTVGQMICHLSDSFRGPMGERPIAVLPDVRGRGFMKWVALSTGLPWPHGLRTMPEVDQQVHGTPPGEFARDVQELRRLVHLFTRSPREFSWQPHPFFLEMTDKQWMRWGYLHMDHHFRQFGA